jgi:hypothetical protein
MTIRADVIGYVLLLAIGFWLGVSYGYFPAKLQAILFVLFTGVPLFLLLQFVFTGGL